MIALTHQFNHQEIIYLLLQQNKQTNKPNQTNKAPEKNKQKPQRMKQNAHLPS